MTEFLAGQFDIAVIGAGHAGIEAALAAALRPELTIVDSLCGDLDFEEGGNPVPTGRMLLGLSLIHI